MNSIYIISLISAINANHMQHELDRLREHYDAMVDIAEIKYGGDCQIEIHDLMDLLCNGFQYCPSNGNCMDKTEYQEFITNYCNSYEDVDYSIQINPSNQHDLTYISLEIQWTFLTTDGCTRKVNEHHKIYYNDEGLITKFYDEPISDDTECSQSGYDSNTDPTIEYPQETVYQDEYRREYSSVQIAEDDPARLLFNEVTNPTELGYIEADLDKLQDQIAKIDAIMASKDFVGMSLSEAWSKDISENTIRYICLIALEEVTPEDGVVVLNVYIQYDVTKLAHAKNNILSGLIDHFGDILCKSKTGKAEDGINLYCTDIEYDGVCDKDTDDEACAMFPSKIKGRDGVLKYFKQYEDIFDEAKSRYDFINDRLITSYRKGSCQGEYSQRIEFEYDEKRQCISKWTEHLGDTMTSDKGCHNSAAAFNRKILEECKFDDEIDSEYIPDEPSSTVEDCQNNIAGIHKFFYALPAIVNDCGKVDYNATVDDLLGLLSDDFTYNQVGDGPHYTLTKNEYKQNALTSCVKYKDVDYTLSSVSCNDVTVESELTFIDGCTLTTTENSQFVFDSQGLISRLDSSVIEFSPIDCPQFSSGDEPATAADDCQNNADGINKYFETMSSIDVGDCNTDNLMDLLSVDFTENYIKHDTIFESVNKDGYRQEVIDYCLTATKFDYALSPISCNNVIVEWDLTLKDGCIMKKMQHLEFLFDYQGLINRLDFENINNASIICPQSNGYDTEPSTTTTYTTGYESEAQQDKPPSVPIANDDYVSTAMNQAVFIDVLENDFDPDRFDLPGPQALIIIDYTQGNNGKVEKIGDRLKYTPNKDACDGDKFIYTVANRDDGLRNSADVHITITCEELVNEYTPKNNIVAGLVNHFGDVLCKSKQGKASDEPNVFCTDIEYEGICDNDADDDACAMFAYSLTGRDQVLQYLKNYEDIFDEATSRYDSINDRLITSYRKGLCQGEYSQRVEFEYDEARQCISKWTAHLGDIMASDAGCHNSAAAFNRKIMTECKFDDEIDNEYIQEQPLTTSGYNSESTTKYSQNEYDVTKVAKNNIVAGLVNHFGDILCKSKAGKAADGINLFCIDVEYDGICDEHTDGESCIMFARTISGRDEVLQHFKEYEDIFDEAISRYDSVNDRLITSYRKGSCLKEYEDIFDEAISRYDSVNDRLITSYRKGLCQGEYSQKVEFEYDEARQCISKWTEHLGETMTSDKGCHNSAAAFNRKILEECKFDDEIDNEYIPDQPSTTFGYKSDSGFDALVKNYEDCEPITTSAYSGSPMLRKKGREMKLKAFYKAAFDCELKENQGNTQLLDTFMDYLSNSVKLCIIEDNACYDKDEIREGMVARYLDDNELIDYQVEIISNDACKIESKCVSQRRTPKGCMVIKEEYDTCLFNNDGSIKEFTVNRSNRRVECDYNDNE
eukprot:CAMPEP_0201592758 /NCGR_PEP_ID=MMETSP0190_2-20130828/190563_1 /ASSEMBLY_ACC=CAM_ASM_000263 /TAXON_ID=37353 /ORGANISM="Rosalina sp." /LENGTH=1416 /DNA_ID=CAMNT_0048051671 /DNA_START=59 /DNA_END=4309 /DNA_ORIENTATION=-